MSKSCIPLLYHLSPLTLPFLLLISYYTQFFFVTAVLRPCPLQSFTLRSAGLCDESVKLVGRSVGRLAGWLVGLEVISQGRGEEAGVSGESPYAVKMMLAAWWRAPCRSRGAAD